MKNKVVVITGAGKGIGAACARYLGALGAQVVVNNRRHGGERESSADRVVKEIVASGRRGVANYGPVENAYTGNGLLALALKTFGRLDCVVANAGIAENARFYNQSPEDFRRVVEINLFGAVNVLLPAFRHMCDVERGSIVISASTAGLFGEFGLPAYSASKAGLIGLMHSLSLEGARKNVRANAIAPYAATQMTNQQLPDRVGERIAARHVAPVVGWLAGDDCDASGEIIVCGGGKVQRARTMAGRTWAVPDAQPSGWDRVLADAPTRPFSGAMQHFEEFLSEID